MSLENRVFGTIDEGAIEFVLYKDEYYDSFKEAMYNGYFQHECVAVGCGLDRPEAESARVEMMWFAGEMLKDGVSIVARDTRTGKVVGHVVNQLHVPDDPKTEVFLEKLPTSSDESREIMRFMTHLKDEGDLMKLHNVDTMLEIMLLGVLPEYRQRSIGLLLVKYSLELAKNIQSGHALDLLPVELRETGSRLKVVISVFASNYSKRIGDILGFKTRNEIFYDEVVFHGKTYADRIPNKLQKSCTLTSLEL